MGSPEEDIMPHGETSALDIRLLMDIFINVLHILKCHTEGEDREKGLE